MLLFWLALALGAQSPQALPAIGGLRAGESLSAGPAEAAWSLRECSRGRLLDGTTGAPVPGAEVEAWVEGWSRPSEPVARGVSEIDGSFRIPHPNVAQVDKLLVRAPGYRRTTVTLSDAREIFLMPPAEHLGLRVLDLEGKPIAGARAQSRQTCAHGPPAFDGVSDQEGRFDLASFPPLDDEPEIVVTAPGYGAVLLQSPEAMLAPGGLEVRLPRRAPIAFVVVDAAGKALGFRRVSLGAEPHWIVAQTDARGRAVFESPFFGRELWLQIEHEGEAAYLAAGLAPASFEPRLVFVPFDSDAARSEDEDTVLGRLSVVDEQDRPLDLLPRAVHGKGAELEGVGALRPGWGRTSLFAGGPFSGYVEQVRVIDRPGDVSLKLAREPRVKIVLPEQPGWLVHVQSGEDSITLESPAASWEQPVPEGGPLFVCAVSEDETRLAKLERVEPGATLDLTSAQSVVARAPEPGPMARHRVSLPGVALQGHVRTYRGWIDPHADGSFEVPVDARIEGRIGGEGRVPRSFAPSFASLGEGPEPRVELLRRGSLSVRGGLRALFAGGDPGAADPQGGFTVDELAPGPLLVDVVRLDGSVVSLSLRLEEGEQRVLTLP